MPCTWDLCEINNIRQHYFVLRSLSLLHFWSTCNNYMYAGSIACCFEFCMRCVMIKLGQLAFPSSIWNMYSALKIKHSKPSLPVIFTQTTSIWGILAFREDSQKRKKRRKEREEKNKTKQQAPDVETKKPTMSETAPNKSAQGEGLFLCFPIVLYPQGR